MDASREMPKYKCHKEVWALKIKSVSSPILLMPERKEIARMLYFEEPGYGPLEVTPEWNKKHSPKAGGYYVVYKDGYASYSPADAFEDGYSLMD